MTTNETIENGGNSVQVGDQVTSVRRQNPPLSDSALVLLSAAANRDNGSVLPPPADLKARGGALKAVLKLLLARELVERCRLATMQRAGGGTTRWVASACGSRSRASLRSASRPRAMELARC